MEIDKAPAASLPIGRQGGVPLWGENKEIFIVRAEYFQPVGVGAN